MKEPRNLIEIFTQHKVASNLAMVLMLMAGVWAISKLNVQLNPTREQNYVNVSIAWRGASAEDVEKLITIPLEQQIKTLPDIKTLRSTTRNMFTNLSVELEEDADLGKAVDLIKQRVAQIRSFPVDIEPPTVSRNEQQELVAAVLITGPDNLEELIPLARKMEQQLLADGIDMIGFQGLPAQEIAIQVDNKTLYELGLSFNQLGLLLSGLSQDSPGGTVGRGQMARQLRSLDQRRDADGFNQLPLFNDKSGRLVRIGDIATVTRRAVIDQPYSSVGGKPAIAMFVRRDIGTDSLLAANILNSWYERTVEQLDSEVNLQLFLEAWKYIEDELSLIIKNGSTGLLLVVLSLLLFLHLRVAFWVMMGIPITFFAALLGFYYTGGTINALSLIGFVMALGIIVDDAIVVGEESLTQFQNGHSPAEAATMGANRMFAPVVASSLTTLCAFLPLLMSPGSEITEIPLIMIWVIAASLIECFLVLPGHLRHSFEAIQRKSGSFTASRFNQRFEVFREQTFRPIVRYAMRNRRIVIASALTLFAITLTLWISGWLKTNLNLSIDFEQLTADIQFVGGATEQQKSNYLRDVELALDRADQDNGGNNVVNYLTVSNLATVDNEQKQGSQYASINVEMISPEQRQLTAEEFTKVWHANIPISPVVDSLQVKESASFWSDFTLLLKGGDVATLKMASEELMHELKKLEGVKNLHDDLPYGKEQWIFSLTTEGRALGLTISDVGRQLRAAFDGQRVQIFQDDEAELEVRLILPERERTNLASLGQFPIRTAAGDMLPLASVATWSGKRGIDVIRHHDVQKTITISGDVDLTVITGREVVTHAIDNIFPQLLKKYELTYGLDRMSAAERESETEFLLSFMYALGLIYIVLVWVFSSYTWPLAVMAAIPMGLTGALGGHLLMGMHVGPMSMLGMFALTGIVVNDSIILITTYKKLIEEGIPPQQAIEDAVCSRLRAVILTSLTTIAGLFPLMLEQAPIAQIFTPLAAAICFGLAYGTALVLIVIPATLSVMVTLSQKFVGKDRDPTDPHPGLGATGPLVQESN